MLNFQVALLNSFELEPHQRAKLKSYYRLHWQLGYLMRKLEDDGTLTHAGVKYIPIYKDEFVSLGDMEQQVKLSFRQWDADPEGFNYVLIRRM